MDELQAAVLVCLDPLADASLKQQALAYCHRISSSADGCAFVLQSLSLTMKPEVAFWCLTVIRDFIADTTRYTQFTTDQRNRLRSTLLVYFTHAVYPQHFHSTSAPPPPVPSFLLNKLAQAIVALMAADYPQAWPTAFSETILPLVGHTRSAVASTFHQVLSKTNEEKGVASNTPPTASQQVTYESVAMFLRLLRAIDDDVTSVRAAQVSRTHHAKSVHFKDAMRDDCISDIMRICSDFLISSERAKLSNQAFDIVARYVEWVDVELIVQPRFVKPIYEAITASIVCTWRASAAAALRAILQKRMNTSSKMRLLQVLDIESLTKAIQTDVITSSRNQDESNVESEVSLQSSYIEVASLVNVIATMALNCIKNVSSSSAKGNDGGTNNNDNGRAATNNISAANVDSRQNGDSSPTLLSDVSPELLAYTSNVARYALPVALQMLDENPDEGTNGLQTLECIILYVSVYGQLARSGQIAANHENVTAIGAVLKSIEERGRYADDIDPTDDRSERTRAFNELRKALVLRIFPSVSRMFPDLCAQFVKELYSKAAVDIGKLELSLALLVSLISTATDNSVVQEVCLHVLSSAPDCMNFSRPVSMNGYHTHEHQHQHRQECLQRARIHLSELVSCSYFEIGSRSTKVLVGSADRQLLSTVLEVIFDERGLGHLVSEDVRSKAAGALVRISKVMRGMMSNGHVEAIVRAAHQHMFPVHEDVSNQRWKNQMLMFETVGYLLATAQNKQTTNGGANVVQLSCSILKTIVDGVTSREGMSCVAYIGAVGYFSKGFSKDLKNSVHGGKEKSDVLVEIGATNEAKDFVATKKSEKKNGVGMPDEMRQMWMTCVESVLKGSESCLTEGEEPWKSEMRFRVIFFLHRMVETVGSGLIWFLERILPELIRNSKSVIELKEVLSLLSQSTIRFREALQTVSDHVDIVIVERVQSLSFNIDEQSGMAVSEEDREVVEVIRGFMYWVNVMVNCGLMDSWWQADGTVRSNKRKAMLDAVMMWVLRNAIGKHMDIRVGASIGKMAWQTIGCMVERWGNKDNMSGMNTFVMQHVGQACVQCVWNERHAATASGEATNVMTEMVRVQSRCTRKYGGAFADALYTIVGQVVGQEDWNLYLTDLTGAPLTSTFQESVQRWVVMSMTLRKATGRNF